MLLHPHELLTCEQSYSMGTSCNVTSLLAFGVEDTEQIAAAFITLKLCLS